MLIDQHEKSTPCQSAGIFSPVRWFSIDNTLPFIVACCLISDVESFVTMIYAISKQTSRPTRIASELCLTLPLETSIMYPEPRPSMSSCNGMILVTNRARLMPLASTTCLWSEKRGCIRKMFSIITIFENRLIS